jgi:hypothetical protein
MQKNRATTYAETALSAENQFTLNGTPQIGQAD